jgi:hypothetical protein
VVQVSCGDAAWSAGSVGQCCVRRTRLIRCMQRAAAGAVQAARGEAEWRSRCSAGSVRRCWCNASGVRRCWCNASSVRQSRCR